MLGGEISGHFFFGDIGRDDGLVATLTMLEALDDAGASLARLVDSVPRYPITPDIRIPCPADLAHEIVAELEAERALVEGNRQLVERFERKVQARLAEVWGEAAE